MTVDIYLEGDKQLKVAVVIEMEGEMERLKNKNILITGGTSGIGLASAQEFEREGARVAICGTDEKKLKEARGALGPKALAFSLTLANYRISIVFTQKLKLSLAISMRSLRTLATVNLGLSKSSRKIRLISWSP